MCHYRSTLSGCNHFRMTRNMSCPLMTCKKKDINKKAQGKCFSCAGKSRGSPSHKSGGVKGITNKMSGTHLSRPKARAKFVDAVKKQKQLWKDEKAKAADENAKAAAAAPPPPPAAAPAPAPALKRPVGTVKTRTQNHVRVVEKRQGK